MENLFEVKVKYEKVCEKDGKIKKVSEKYLVDALSFSEAESRICKEMEAMISGAFVVVGISRQNYSELIIGGEGDVLYKSVLKFETVDEKSGRSRSAKTNVLVRALSVPDADDRIATVMTGLTVPFEVISIADAKIEDIFLYQEEEKNNQ